LKNAKKLAAVLLSLIMCLAIFSACAGNDDGQSSSQGEGDTGTSEPSQAPAEPGGEALPLTEETVTLTVWTRMVQSTQAGITSLNDVLAIQELEARTNVHIEWLHPAIGQEQENFNLLISSGEYPDIFFGLKDFYSGGLEKAYEDDVIIRLNDIIEEYSPNYNEMRHRNKEVEKGTITDSGNILSYHALSTPKQGPWYGTAVRKDWLDDLGLDIPVTYDDWHEMLTAFKEEKGATAPLWIHNRGTDFFGVLSAGYGVMHLGTSPNTGFYQEDGQVKYGPAEEGYREYITMLAQWYSEGLIDPDYYARNDLLAPDELVNTGKTGAMPDSYALLPLHKMMAGDENMHWVAVPYPVKEVGDQLHLGMRSNEVGANASITTACEDVELAAKWFDYITTDEASLLLAYGIEGETFEMVDGKPIPNDMILNNPDGLSVADARDKYTYAGMPGGKYYWERELVGLEDDALEAINVIWAESSDAEWVMPSDVSMTAEEGSEFSRIMGDIDTYATEMTTKFIIGAESLDKFDEYVETIKSMGLDGAIAVRQAALDRYSAR